MRNYTSELADGTEWKRMRSGFILDYEERDSPQMRCVYVSVYHRVP